MGSIPTEVKRFFLYLVWLPDSFTRANAQWVIHGFISTLIYTSELILCFTICVLSATRHNIRMYPYFLFAAIHHLIVPDLLCPTSWLSRQSNGRSNPEVVGSIPTEVKRFFLYLVWLPDSFTRANAQWVIHGFISTLIYTSELILCFTIGEEGGTV